MKASMLRSQAGRSVGFGDSSRVFLSRKAVLPALHQIHSKTGIRWTESVRRCELLVTSAAASPAPESRPGGVPGFLIHAARVTLLAGFIVLTSMIARPVVEVVQKTPLAEMKPIAVLTDVSKQLAATKPLYTKALILVITAIMLINATIGFMETTVPEYEAAAAAEAAEKKSRKGGDDGGAKLKPQPSPPPESPTSAAPSAPPASSAPPVMPSAEFKVTGVSSASAQDSRLAALKAMESAAVKATEASLAAFRTKAVVLEREETLLAAKALEVSATRALEVAGKTNEGSSASSGETSGEADVRFTGAAAARAKEATAAASRAANEATIEAKGATAHAAQTSQEAASKARVAVAEAGKAAPHPVTGDLKMRVKGEDEVFSDHGRSLSEPNREDARTTAALSSTSAALSTTAQLLDHALSDDASSAAAEQADHAASPGAQHAQESGADAGASGSSAEGASQQHLAAAAAASKNGMGSSSGSALNGAKPALGSSRAAPSGVKPAVGGSGHAASSKTATKAGPLTFIAALAWMAADVVKPALTASANSKGKSQ